MRWSLSTKLKLQTYRYTPLEEGQPAPEKTATWSRLKEGLKVLTVICSVLVAFFAGRNWSQSQRGDPMRLDLISRIFMYDERFGEPPSPLTDAAWKSLFPEQGGFFKHPTLAPERSAFSVFHQLHCLNGLREGYWVLHDAMMEGRQLHDDELTMMSSPDHVRHCVDLLRQSLMCKPDLTIEIKNKTVGGVTGFGTDHQCQSWEQLMAWTTTWQTYNQDPRNETASHPHMQHDHGPKQGARSILWLVD